MTTLTINDGIATIDLDDGKANVFSLDASKAVRAALKECQESAKAVIFKGNAKMFSAGFDLGAFAEGNVAAGEAMILEGFELLYDLYNHPLPTIAACEGHALGMGAFMLLCCDTRIAAKGEYKIGLPETAGDLPFRPFLVHLLHAELERRYHKTGALQSQMCDAQTGVDAGYVDHVVDADKVEAMALQAAQQLSQLPVKQYGFNKKLLRAPTSEKMRAALEAELQKK